METLHVKLEGEQKTLTVLQGDAPAPINKQKVKIEGNISAVCDFLAKRKETADEKTSHIEADIENGTIVLLVDADIPVGAEVIAKLYRPKHLGALDINGSKTYTLKEIGELLRKHRFVFDERTEYDSVIHALTNFKAKVESEVENTRNTSNSSHKNLHEKKVLVETQKFKMKTALYVGGPEKTFIVEVCCDVTDASARFWLESIDLIELELNSRKEAIEAQLTTLKTYNYSIIIK